MVSSSPESSSKHIYGSVNVNKYRRPIQQSEQPEHYHTSSGASSYQINKMRDINNNFFYNRNDRN